SKYACHELSFFLQKKDPEFFRTVIAPYLKNKKDKTFLDHWLLGDDLKGYLDPWRFGRLNMIERILLGKRLKEQEASVARDARDQNDLIPPNMEDFNRRFDTAVQTSALEAESGGEGGGGVREELKKMVLKQQANKERALGDLGLVLGATAAAPAAPPPENAPAPAAAHALGLQVANGLVAMDAVAEKGELRARKATSTRFLRRAGTDRDAELATDKAAATDETVFFEMAKSKRDESRRFFQKLDQTKEWAENNYYNLPIEQQLAGLVGVNAFWADYAAHDGQTPFLSKNFPQATRNFTELMFALAVLDLPFKAGQHAEKIDGLRYTVQAATPLVLFHREIREATRAPAGGAVLVAQNFFRADDRFRDENNERYDKFVSDEFLPHVVYGAQIILTNPTGNRQRLQVLLQIPARFPSTAASRRAAHTSRWNRTARRRLSTTSTSRRSASIRITPSPSRATIR
ncbi:MAG: hypothetical protein NTY53_16855, partial [Kiritimatiellaeota bacterium]|nr:hypothetical protein [Kiritimatiellota bacterium]